MEKRRSGTETRQRTEKLNLRLLPSEQRALRTLADPSGLTAVFRPGSSSHRAASGKCSQLARSALIAKARSVRVNKASRKQRSARRGPVRRVNGFRALLPRSMIMAALPSRTLNSTSCSPSEDGLSSIEWTDSPCTTGHRRLPTTITKSPT